MVAQSAELVDIRKGIFNRNAFDSGSSPLHCTMSLSCSSSTQGQKGTSTAWGISGVYILSTREWIWAYQVENWRYDIRNYVWSLLVATTWNQRWYITRHYQPERCGVRRFHAVCDSWELKSICICGWAVWPYNNYRHRPIWKNKRMKWILRLKMWWIILMVRSLSWKQMMRDERTAGSSPVSTAIYSRLA